MTDTYDGMFPAEKNQSSTSKVTAVETIVTTASYICYVILLAVMLLLVVVFFWRILSIRLPFGLVLDSSESDVILTCPENSLPMTAFSLACATSTLDSTTCTFLGCSNDTPSVITPSVCLCWYNSS